MPDRYDIHPEDQKEPRLQVAATGWLWRETVVIPGVGRGREYAIFVSPFCR